MPERYAAAVIVAAWSGLRSGELRALARRHVDLDAGTIRVERAILELSGQKPTFGRTKTEGSRRVVALPEFVMEQLRRHMEAYVGSSEGSLLFCTEDGGILTRTWLGQMFRRAQKRAGLESLGLAWHDLRHTGASLAYAVGSSVVDVQRRLGHTTMTAANRYAHAYASSDAAVAARLHPGAAHRESPAEILAQDYGFPPAEKLAVDLVEKLDLVVGVLHAQAVQLVAVRLLRERRDAGLAVVFLRFLVGFAHGQRIPPASRGKRIGLFE